MILSTPMTFRSILKPNITRKVLHELHSFNHRHQLYSSTASSTTSTTTTSQSHELKIPRKQQRIVHLQYVKVKSGRGGKGAVHFGREPYKEIAPADGGDGGDGGDVYIQCSGIKPNLRHLGKSFSAGCGAPGTKYHGRGRNGDDCVIRVPYGCVITEVPQNSGGKDVEELDHEESVNEKNLLNATIGGGGADGEEMTQTPMHSTTDDSTPSSSRRRNKTLLSSASEPLYIDVHPHTPPHTKFLILRGGRGGLGNHHFATSTNRSPMVVEEGSSGVGKHLKFEVKTIADVGLVGMPNAGKSTFLSGVSRCDSPIGSYAFTTLTPFLGTVQFPAKQILTATPSSSPPLNSNSTPSLSSPNLSSSQFDDHGVLTIPTPDALKTLQPPFSMTIADIPGLIAGSSENKGLGHGFLRNIERATLLVYVVELCGRPVESLQVLLNELEAYQPGLAFGKSGIILANKADVVSAATAQSSTQSDGNSATGKHQLQLLQSFVQNHSSISLWPVVPISAKYGHNVPKALSLMRTFVEEARERENASTLLESQTHSSQSPKPIWQSPKYVRGVLHIQ